MKRLGLLICILLFNNILILAQQNPLVVFSDDIRSNIAGTSRNIANRGVSAHIITWSVQTGGLSACTIAIESSADNVSWTSQGTGNCTLTGSTGYLTFVGNYIRVRPTVFAVSSTPVLLTVNYAGYINANSTTVNGADGTILDGANSSIKATVKDYANSNPLAAILVDINGDPTGGAAVSMADGASVTLGSRADPKSTATDTTSVTLMQVMKQVSASVQAPPSQAVTNAGTFSVQATSLPALPTGNNVIGHVITDAMSTTAVTGTVAVQSGGLNIATETTLASLANSQNSATTGQKQQLIACATTTAAPTFSNSTSNPCSQQTDGAIRVAVTNGAAGGTSQADNATFTANTTNDTPIAGFYEASPSTCTTGKACAVGITTNREQKISITSISAPATGVQTEANSDSITCNSDANCDVDVLTVPTDPFGVNADAASASGSISAKLREIATNGSPIKAGTALIGSVVPWAGGTLASGVTAAITGTTSTSVIGATASNYIYVTSCTVSNTDADTSTEVVLQDGSGGTTLWVIPAPFGPTNSLAGAIQTFPIPLKVPTVGNALFAAPLTTGSSTKVACQGFKSTVSY